ncbi:flagellar export chaperone FlgN [Shewanella sp.]|uniref:flagellar export chaperone FlgN n=1 Tax=Shewanella sp. TaxID=50422 RepID=UPI003A980476
MSESIKDLKGFFASIRGDINQLNLLIAQFERQYELLSNRDGKQLPDLNDKMLTLLDELRLSNQGREQYLKQLGLPGDKEGLKMLQAKLPTPTRNQVANLLKEISLKVQTCNMMNERAGKLLACQRNIMTQLGNLKNQQAYPDFRA